MSATLPMGSKAAANEKVEEAAAAVGDGPVTPERRRCVIALLRQKVRRRWVLEAW